MGPAWGRRKAGIGAALPRMFPAGAIRSRGAPDHPRTPAAAGAALARRSAGHAQRSRSSVLRSKSALVLSRDTVAAALVGGIAELAGLAPVFLSDGDRPRDVLRRVRPATMLADCDESTADAYIGPAMLYGTRVGLFCASADAAAAERSREIAERYDLAFFVLPQDLDALGAYLYEVARATRDGADR